MRYADLPWLFLLLLGEILIYAGASLDAIHDGHVDVEDDRIEVRALVARDVVQGLEAVRRRDHYVEILLEAPLESIEQEWIVIRNQANTLLLHAFNVIRKAR